MREINPLEEVAIKYKKIRLDDNYYVLIPVSTVQGFSMGEEYLSREKFKIASTKANVLNEKYLVDEIVLIEDLQMKYDLYDPNDVDFLCDYYFEESKNKIILIKIVDDRIKKRLIEIPQVGKMVGQEVYERQKRIPSVVLNDTTLEELLETTNLSELKAKLKRLKLLVNQFIEEEHEQAVTKITVTDGEVSEIQTNNHVIEQVEPEPEPKRPVEVRKDEPVPSDFSLLGLEQYLKERIFGQDKHLRKIAKSLYMNYTAEKGERVDSILLVGPTGSGKTETFRVASQYLSIPFKEVNSVNLVPQGIVGESLEDCLYALVAKANGNLSRAEKGIIFCDEIDKLSNARSDVKSCIPDILLKFVEGDEFSFTKGKKAYTFDTSLLSKALAGSFTRIYEPEKQQLGFAVSQPKAKSIELPENIKDKIKEKDYFGIELLDRLRVAVKYDELTRETKKRLLLESKVSEYLLKKQRYQRQFGVELIADDSYIEAIFDAIEDMRDSIRILNNLVVYSLDTIEYGLGSHSIPSGKRLILTKDTVENPDNFTII